VLGFQLLEEKDEGSLVAVAVTPMSLDQYFLYRATLYALVSVPLVVVLHELLGVVALDPEPLACPSSIPRPASASCTGSSGAGPWPGELGPVEDPLTSRGDGGDDRSRGGA
jgi:hypothetical protein